MKRKLLITNLSCLLLAFGLTMNVAAGNGDPKPNKLDIKYKKQLESIKLPAGFHISVFAEVKSARSICLGPDGTVFVGTREKGESGKVYALPDKNKDGKPDEVVILAKGLNAPNGVAFKDGDLYVGEINRIIKFPKILSNLKTDAGFEVVYDKYPTEEHHGAKFIAFGPDGWLYVPVGAPCNICERLDNPVFSTITRLNVESKKMEIYASGIRNSVGFSWHPDTKALWFTSNGRDELGDDLPPDILATAPKQGLNFGYPYCHAGYIKDPEFGSKHECSEFAPTAQKLQAHGAALGMRFYTGKSFPADYNHKIFICEHGSWNRSKKVGYRVTTVTLDKNNNPVKYEPFATGWLQSETKVLGRPVDVQVIGDGSLLISDDHAGLIYKVTYKK